MTTWWKQDAYDWHLQVLLPLVATGVIAVGVVAATVGVRQIVSVRRIASRPAAPAGILAGAVAVGLLLGTPVGVRWNDGCHGHDGRVPLLTAPVAALAKPEKGRVSYDEIVDLNACIDDPRPFRPRRQPG